MENIRKHRNIKLVTTEEKYLRTVMKPNFKSGVLLGENLMGCEIGKIKVVMNKPVYLGQVILDLSKIVMYEFHYDYMVPKYSLEKLKLCYIDTDSLVYDIKIEDFYEDIANDVDVRFDTSGYSKTDFRPLPIGLKKKVIGLMKDELGGKIMTDFVALRPKLYSYKKLDGSEDKKCKGIKKCVVQKTLTFGGRLFRQVIGIPMGTNCAPLLADLFLYSYENEFLDNMIRSGHRRLARSFNLCYRYIDDLIVFNNKKFLDYLKEIYPSQLTVEKANKSDHLADYLDLTFIIDSGGKLSTRLYDKRDDFDFHIVNFPFLSSNIPSGPSYGVYISQLIRYARCCSHYDDFRYRHKCLVDRLLSQGYKALRLEKSFKKFYGRYQDLIEKYRRSVNAMVSDSFPGQFLFNM